jgi:hypothetical protein
MLTIDENGNALTITQDECTMPDSYSFECINDFVHNPNTNFEDLQSLALGMAAHIESMRKNNCLKE